MELKILLSQEITSKRFYFKIYRVKNAAVKCTPSEIENGNCVEIESVQIPEQRARYMLGRSGLNVQETANSIHLIGDEEEQFL